MSVISRLHVLIGYYKTGSFTAEEDKMIRQAVMRRQSGVDSLAWKGLAAVMNRHVSRLKRRWFNNLSDKKRKGNWLNEEKELVLLEGSIAAKERRVPNWTKLGIRLCRSPDNIGKYWHNVLNPALRKGKWTADEDQTLRAEVGEALEEGRRIDWSEIGRQLHRPGHAASIRWSQCLDPALKWGRFENAEDEIIMNERTKGAHWVDIAKRLCRSRDAIIKRHKKLVQSSDNVV